jgi:hypothetical protein
MPRASNSSATTWGMWAAAASAAESSGEGSLSCQRCGGAMNTGSGATWLAAEDGSSPAFTRPPSQIFVLSVGIVDHDIAEAFDAFQQLLVVLVPLSGGFVEKDNALVDEA